MLDIFLDYIYPRNIKCIVCKCPIDKGNSYSLCKDCFREIKFITNSCYRCGKVLTDFYKEDLCPVCSDKEYNFDRGFCCTVYDDNIHKIIYSFKYGGNTFLSYPIAQIMKDKIHYEGIYFDYIVPVPLHKNRKNKRGFNQAFLISKNLGKFMDKEVLDIVIRNKDTRFLSKLSKFEREIELKDSFTISKEKYKIVSKDILLIDDIFTTGTTSSEIAKILKNNGANKVYALSFASGRNIY
ncbi:ComF family protein [Alkalithermobacter paradoxus]|uniref:Ribose-phosphate pyrophosphokinase n=1 Tax=Alkalithermobacter paradoxus TaxID=29349 RepID=A0A1V4I7U3_9FIRM|nr:ribose-phosphate pyrophosphokinase [[Clostridium] thermoalcaliphilum]